MLLAALLTTIHMAFSALSSCPNLSFICSGCTKSYNFNAQECVSVCPSGSTLQGSTCVIIDPSFTVFYADLSQDVDLTTSEIAGFTTPIGTFSTPGSPFPTKDRGVYFSKPSYLNLKSNPVPSSIQSIQLWTRILTTGIIFSITGSSGQYLTLSGIFDIVLGYRYCRSGNDCTYLSEAQIFTGTSGPKLWTNLEFTIEVPSVDTIDFTLWRDYQSTTFSSPGENALYISDERFTWTLGAVVDSFEGFIYTVAARNYYEQYYLPFVNPPICNPYFYYENYQCIACPASCTNPIWCVRGTDCSYCSSNTCTSCTGYSDARCIGQTCPSYCSSCSDSAHCSVCKPNLMLLKFADWGTYCYSNMWIFLMSSWIEDFVQSGSDASNTYLGSPDPNDPVAYPCRGYYFDGLNKYFTTRANNVLPTNMLIYMWVYPISGTIISKGKNLRIAVGESYINLYKMDGSIDITQYFSSISTSNWKYIAYKLEYTEFSTTFTTYIDSVQRSITSTVGYYYQDSINDQFYIGTDLTNYFKGFIALVGVASYLIQTEYSNILILSNLIFYCGVSLNPCPITPACETLACSVKCSKCDKCLDSATCYTCPYGYYSSGSTQQTLMTSGKINVAEVSFPDRGSCLYSPKGLSCTSCTANYVLYYNICITMCPSGYTASSGGCNEIDSVHKVVSTEFSNIIKLSSYSGFNIGSDHISEYPLFDANDPIPALDRGYYFTSNTYMSHNSIFIGPHFAIAFWIRFTGYGDVFSKPINSTNDAVKLNYSADKMYFSISTSFKDAYVEDPNTSNFKSWTYIQLTSWYDSVNLETTLTTYINQVWSAKVCATFTFNEDLPTRLFFLGSAKGYGFTGFLYSVEVYTKSDLLTEMYTVTCNYGSRCPSTAVVLTECDIQDYMTEGCGQCSSCQNGCVRGTDCNLCADSLCLQCEHFSGICNVCAANAVLNANVCVCDYGYYQDTAVSCAGCDPICETCNGASSTDCLSCKSGYLWFDNYSKCLLGLACPTNSNPPISRLLTACTVSSSHVFYTVLNELTDTFVDSASGIMITTGADSQFFTTYAVSDPKVASGGRGYFFNQTSYLTIDPLSNSLILGPEFTIGIWAMISTEGILFVRKDSSPLIRLYFSNGFFSTISSSSRYLIGPIVYTQDIWNLFEIHVSTISSGPLIEIFLNGGLTSLMAMNYQFVDSISSVSTYLGSDEGSSGIIGFIYSIEIYNMPVNININSNPTCFYPIDASGCLSTCNFNQYTPDCRNCLTVCNYGCSSAQTCSLCSDPLCSVCNPLSVCTSCIQGAVFTALGCRCVLGFNSVTLQCILAPNCYKNCATCSNSTASGCLQCISGYYMVNKYCMFCPTGFFNSTSGNCETLGGLAFDVDLNTLDGVIYDNVNKIPVITGNSAAFYPDFDSEDPYPAYLRGFYFTGISSVINLPSYKSWTSPSLVLSPTFTIQIWIKPLSSSGCVFSSSSLNGTLLSFCYSPLNYTLQANISELDLTITAFNYSVGLNFWQILIISLDNNQSNTLSLYMNLNLVGSKSLGGAIFPNYCNNTSIIFGKSQQIYFEGFIYQIKIYNTLVKLARVLQSATCPLMLNGRCMVECSIHELWVGPNHNECGTCKSYCKFGCRRNDTCSLCEDPLCQYCSSYNNGMCTKCMNSATNITKCECVLPAVLDHSTQKCETCKSNQFYNGLACEDCFGLCTTCIAEQCLTCVENSVISNNTCACLPGLNGTIECLPAYFNYSLISTERNVIYLNFQEELIEDIKKSQLIMQTTCGVSVNYNLEKWSSRQYQITPYFSSEILNECSIQICIKNNPQIFSIVNSALNNSCESAEITLNVTIISAEQTNSSEQVSSTLATTYTVASVSITLASPNPACLWSFINTIQMLCFISLSSVSQPPRFKGFLKGLKKYNMFPNVFEYFVPHYGGVKPFKNAYEFGYKDNLLLFNVGNYVSAFLSMIAIWFFVYLLSKMTGLKPFSIEFIKNKIFSTLQNYKYGAFVRFWITCYLDVISASIIAVITYPSPVWTSILNIVLALFFIIVIFATPFIFFYFSYTKKQEIAQETEVSANWGTLFYEFNNDKGLASSQFYFYFFLRRLLYIVIQIFLQGVPIIQLTCNIILSLSNLAYLLIFRPFSEIILNISNSLSESGIFLIFLLLATNLMQISELARDKIDVTLVGIINAIMAVQMAASIGIFLKVLTQVLRKKCSRTVVPINFTAPYPKDTDTDLKIKEI